MNRKTNRTGWLITVLVVIAFVVLKSRVIPNISVPYGPQAGKNYQFTALMKSPTKQGLSWVLSRRADDTQYVVEAFNNQQAQRAFSTVRSDGKQIPGHSYSCTGTIKINGHEYQASNLAIHADGTSATITLVPVQASQGTTKAAS